MTAEQTHPQTRPLPTPSSPKWYARRWVQLVAVFVVGLGIGGAGGSSSASDAETRATAAEARVEAAEKAAADAQAQASSAQAAADKKVASQLAALSAQKAALDARAKAIGGAEAEAEANEFDGDGLYLVGSDIKAGTYKSAGGEACYWARHNKANDILDNHLGSGPTVVVVRSSDFSLEVNGCATFRRT